MNISLTNELEEFVKTQVASGHYTSASEVIREALRGHIRGRTVEGIQAQLELSRQQAKEGHTIAADDDYFEQKRQRVREKYLSNTAA